MGKVGNPFRRLGRCNVYAKSLRNKFWARLFEIFHVLAKRSTPPKLPGLEGSRYRLRRAWAGVTCFFLETRAAHIDHPMSVSDTF